MESKELTESKKEAWKPHWEVAIRNTAGEFEQEMLSRKKNAIEFFGVMAFILIDLWLLAYPAVLLGIEWLNTLSIILLVIGALYLFFVSPNIHKDEFHGWGLGNPIDLVKEIRKANRKRKYLLIIIVMGLIVGLTLAVYFLWNEVADFINIDQETALDLKDSMGGSLVIILLGAIVAFLFSTICIRYDNFLSALKTAFLIIIPMAIFMLILGPLINGLDVFEAFKPGN